MTDVMDVLIAPRRFLGGIGWSVRRRRDAFILHGIYRIAGLHGWAAPREIRLGESPWEPAA